MEHRIMIECPQCDEKFIADNGCNEGWASAIRCPKCGCFIMKS